MSPMLPAITNVLATDELRGRYNAMGSMIFGVTGIIGPLTAAPLIGHHLGQVWIVPDRQPGVSRPVSRLLSLRRLLTPGAGRARHRPETSRGEQQSSGVASADERASAAPFDPGRGLGDGGRELLHPVEAVDETRELLVPRPGPRPRRGASA